MIEKMAAALSAQVSLPVKHPIFTAYDNDS
jgi:hypothetical protein